MSMNQQTVIDVTERDFQVEVLDRSHEVPVVVDFWAPWCGPCRVLGPVLERLAAEHAGEFQLVKLNTDENPQLSTEFRIRSIPAVKAFRDGKLVDEFVGALPEAQIKAWLARLLPSEADRLTNEGLELATDGYANAAEDRFRQALALDVNHPKAIAALGRMLFERGETDEARTLLRRMPGDAEIGRLIAEIELKSSGGSDLDRLQGEAETNPRDPGAQYALGAALAAAGDHTRALETLLTSVRLDKRFDDDVARKAMLRIFQLLGDGDPLTIEYRRRLSSVLF
jgi:putative thioredoxin